MSFPVPPPEVPDPILEENGWVRMNENRESISIGPLEPLELEAYLRTRVYRDAELQKEIRENTVGRLDRCLNVFFATRTHIEPEIDNLPFGVGRRQVLELARTVGSSEFEKRLRERGGKNVGVVGEDELVTETGKKAELDRIRATYDYDCVDVEIAEDIGFVIDGGDIDLTGWIGFWHHDGDLFIAGGVYPAEDFEKKVSVDLTDSIDVEVGVDLELWPRPYKPEMFNLIRTVR